MKKLLLFFALIIAFNASAQVSDATLTTSANTIKNETAPRANTATRNGQMLLDIINSKPSLLGTYSNPPWITGLNWSKILLTPTTLAGYGITDAVGHAIQDEGSSLTQRSIINFVGPGVVATDAGGKTVVTIAGGGSVTDADATTKGILKLYPSTSLGSNTDGAPDQNAVKNYVDVQDAGKQPIDGDLTAIGGLSHSDGDFIQDVSGTWSRKTLAQIKTALGLSNINSGDQDLSSYVTSSSLTSVQSTLQANIDAKQTLNAQFSSSITASRDLTTADKGKKLLVNGNGIVLTLQTQATSGWTTGDWFLVEQQTGNTFPTGATAISPVNGSVNVESSSTGFTVPNLKSAMYVEYRGSNFWHIENGIAPVGETWTTYTSTVVGTGTPTMSLFRYVLNGKTLKIWANFRGPTNATGTLTFTLPSGLIAYNSGGTTGQFGSCSSTNNTTGSMGYFYILNNTSIVSVYKDAGAVAWTITGTQVKGFDGFLQIEVQ